MRKRDYERILERMTQEHEKLVAENAKLAVRMEEIASQPVNTPEEESTPPAVEEPVKE